MPSTPRDFTGRTLTAAERGRVARWIAARQRLSYCLPGHEWKVAGALERAVLPTRRRAERGSRKGLDADAVLIDEAWPVRVVDQVDVPENLHLLRGRVE